MRRLALHIALLMTVASAHATTCGGPNPVCKAYFSSDLVVRASVLGISYTSTPPIHASTTYPDGTTSTALNSTVSVSHNRMQILETFRGTPGSEITVLSSGYGFQFKPGEVYLLFLTAAKDGSGDFVTDVCTPTHLFKDDLPDNDLAWLRAFSTAPATVSVFGKFVFAHYPEELAPGTVTLVGPVTRKAAPADGNFYRFDDLPPGTYTVTAQVPAGELPPKPQTVTLEAKHCAELDFYIVRDLHVGGVLVGPDGRPMPKTFISLLTPSDSRTGYNIVTTVESDVSGNWIFPNVAPGDYWLAANRGAPNNNNPNPATFYPSGTTPDSAQLLHITAEGSIDGLSLKLPPPLEPITLHLEVRNADSSPAHMAHLIAVDPANPVVAIAAQADSSGHGDITLYAGREYFLIASTAGNLEPGCAGPAHFIAKPGMTLPPLVFDKSWNACRALQHPAKP